ncbi:MAG: ABC transporter ATP-binding protein [Chlamydiales bacterium]
MNLSQLIEIDDLNLFIRHPGGEIQLLHQLQFAVHPGEIVGLVGESGSGKSLTIQSILRLLPAEMHRLTGKIIFEGKNLLDESEKSLRQVRGSKIGFVAQDPASALNPTLRIGTQLIEGLMKGPKQVSRKEAWQRGIEWLKKMRISHPELRMRQYPHELSGGMKQRICLAMALISGPALLLADEPTTALDVTVQAEILSILKELRDEHCLGILLITHDLGVVANCCDRALVMRSGRILETSSVDRLFAHPQHSYTQELLESKQNLVVHEVEA